MTKKELSRRRFLSASGAAMLSATVSCYSVSSTVRQQICYHAKNLEDRVRVATYNIANARGNYDEFWKVCSKETITYNLNNIAAMSAQEGVEVLCMNEVDFDSRRSHNIDQAEYLAKQLCFNHVIRQHMFSLPGMIDVGNAIISKYPLKVNYHRQYGETYFERIRQIFKTMLDFDIEYKKGKQLNIIQTHFDHNSEKNRIKEAKILLNYLQKKKDRFVLLGDFNSGPGRPAYDMIIKSGLVHNKKAGILSFRSDKPKHSIDHIVVSRGLRITDYHTVWAEMSDHRPVIGDIIL